MTLVCNVRSRICRMEEARRQTQLQFDIIDRQITRRMTVLIPHRCRTNPSYRPGKSPDPSAFLERYRSCLAAITSERQSEIDALTQTLARQDQAIEALRTKLLPSLLCA